MFIYWIKVTEYGEVKKLSICQFKIYVMKILLAFNGVHANGGRKRVSWCCSTVFIRRKSVPMFCDDLYSAGFRRFLTKYFYHVIGQIHCQPLASSLLSSQGLQSSHAVTPVLDLWWLDMERGGWQKAAAAILAPQKMRTKDNRCFFFFFFGPRTSWSGNAT